MKKTKFVFCLTLIFLYCGINRSFSQCGPCSTSEVSNYLKYGEIDKALYKINYQIDHCKNYKTKMVAIWYYSGIVHYAIYTTKDEQYSKLETNALEKSVTSYLIALRYNIKDSLLNDIFQDLKILDIYCEKITTTSQIIDMEVFNDILDIRFPQILINLEKSSTIDTKKKEKYKLIINGIINKNKLKNK